MESIAINIQRVASLFPRKLLSLMELLKPGTMNNAKMLSGKIWALVFALMITASLACRKEEPRFSCGYESIYTMANPNDINSPCLCREDNGFRTFGWNGGLCLRYDELTAINQRELGVGAYFFIYEERIPTYFSDTLVFYPSFKVDTIGDELFPRITGSFFGEPASVNPRFMDSLHATYCRDVVGSSTFIRSPRIIGITSAIRDATINDARLPAGMEFTIVNTGHDLDLNCMDLEGARTFVTMQSSTRGGGYTAFNRSNPDDGGPDFLPTDTIAFRVERIPADW